MLSKIVDTRIQTQGESRLNTISSTADKAGILTTTEITNGRTARVEDILVGEVLETAGGGTTVGEVLVGEIGRIGTAVDDGVDHHRHEKEYPPAAPRHSARCTRTIELACHRGRQPQGKQAKSPSTFPLHNPNLRSMCLKPV